LDTRIDICLKYKLTAELEKIIEGFGLASIRQIDVGDSCYSAVESVGIFLISQGRGEVVRRMASECIMSGNESRREAFLLANLLVAVDPSDARRLVKRVVGAKGKGQEEWGGPAGKYVRDHIF